jgi:hypothetical protein
MRISFASHKLPKPRVIKHILAPLAPDYGTAAYPEGFLTLCAGVEYTNEFEISR